MKLFAETCEKLLNESGSLKKIEIISDALSEIKDERELYLFCLYLTGRIYPTSVQKTISVGKAWIRDAVIKLARISEEEWDTEFRKVGESGDTTIAILRQYVNATMGEKSLNRQIDKSLKTKDKLTSRQADKQTKSPLELIEDEIVEYSPQEHFPLQDLAKYIDKLNETAGSLAKVKILIELLSKLEPVQAKYIVKILLQNLRIGVQEATVEAAISKAFDVEKKEVSHLNFYLGDIGEVALRCKNKDFSNIEFRLFHPIKAMLASAEVEVDEIFSRMSSEGKKKSKKDENVIPVSTKENTGISSHSILDEIPASAGMTDQLNTQLANTEHTNNFKGVWAEYKYDGIRAHIHKSGNRVEIFTRDLKRITDQFPEIVKFYQEIKPDNFLMDGEIVPFSGGKIQPFAFVQRRLGRKEKLEEEVEKNPTIFIAYDFIFYEGETLFEKPLADRRKMLEETFKDYGQQFSTMKIVKTPEEFHEFFRESKDEGREGLMIKKDTSKYESGKRGINWLKYKQTLDPLDVVILKAEWGEGKNSQYLSSFTFGVWDEEKKNLIPIGRVASGTTEEELKHFTKLLPEIAEEKIPTGFILKPQEILEVGFENIQVSERYSSGWAVRFPRLLRIRTGDKPLDEISTIQDVKRIYKEIKGKTTS